MQYQLGNLDQLVTTANDIHFPAGQPVDISLESRDVIHSFWVPELHGKVDLIPGLVNRIRVQSDTPRTYRGECAEFCGPQHAHMILQLTADTPEQFQAWLAHARQPAVPPTADNPQAIAGGLFDGKMEWVAVVDRDGRVCATAAATDDPASAWLGSQSIAKAKAYTANAFSHDDNPMSTARLYTMAQPGHSLFGAANGNPFNADCLVAPQDAGKTDGRICGGTIAFGGGVALYKNKTRVGGIGASGDTACADHEIAKRIRHLAGLDPEHGEYADDIVYATVDGASEFAHPMCENTWRNGKKLGTETVAKAY